jgi:hypothetical protein
MKTFTVTYFNGLNKKTTTLKVKAKSLHSAIAEENRSIEQFKKINPFLEIVSIK